MLIISDNELKFLNCLYLVCVTGFVRIQNFNFHVFFRFKSQLLHVDMDIFHLIEKHLSLKQEIQ